MIELELFGDPIPQIRARSGSRGFYNPQIKQKEAMQWQMRSLYRSNPLSGPIEFGAFFYFQPPESTSKIRKKQMLEGKIKHVVKPDVDNLLKFIFDAGNEILWSDDRQICRIVRIEKLYDEKPRTVIFFDQIGGIPCQIL